MPQLSDARLLVLNDHSDAAPVWFELPEDLGAAPGLERSSENR